MTLHDIAHFFHMLGHRHDMLAKDGLGRFNLCTPRLPWARTYVRFQPDFDQARWYLVPYAKDEDGKLLFLRLAQTDSPEQAMALLRSEYEKNGYRP